MTVAQPTHLLILNETSGTSITNYGTAGTAFTIQQGTAPTNYAWHPNTGPLDGFYEGITNNGSSMPYATTTGTNANTLVNIKFACRFQVQSLDNSSAAILGRGASDFGMRVRAVSPAGSGNFDLDIRVDSSTFSQTRTVSLTALTFNTDYPLAVIFKASTPASTDLRVKLGSNAVVASGTQDWTGIDLDTEQITFCKPDDFTNIRGFDGYMYFWAYHRGGADWTDTDLADINTAPKTNIGGWPGGGPSGIPKTTRLTMLGVG